MLYNIMVDSYTFQRGLDYYMVRWIDIRSLLGFALDRLVLVLQDEIYSCVLYPKWSFPPYLLL